MVNRGDALFHIARVKDPETSRARIGRIGGEPSVLIDFDDGMRIERAVAAMARSFKDGRWTSAA